MALTTATIIALGGAAVGAGMNLVQAGKARDGQKTADRAAARLMNDAKAKIQKNYYEGLKIPTEAYDQAYEANAQVQRDNIEALQQADSRTLAAGVGRVAAASNENTQQIREQQAQQMFELDKLKAEGEENMTQQLAAMDVAQAQDQAKRAAQADEQVGMLKAGAVNSVIGGITAAASAQELNTMSEADKALSKTYKDNEALFKAQGIDRNVFLQNPSNYKIDNGKLTIIKPAVKVKPAVAESKPILVKNVEDDPTAFDTQMDLSNTYRYNFEPKVDYAFGFQDRLNSLRPS